MGSHPSRPSDQELDLLARTAPGVAGSLATELLDLRKGVRRMRRLLTVYDNGRVRQAWIIAGDLVDSELGGEEETLAAPGEISG